MAHPSAVAIFLTLMAVILITPLLSERVRLPGVVGIILGGMLVGPYGLKLLPSSEIITILAEIGLLYLMFSAGLEVNLHQFSRVRNKAITFGVLTFGVPLVLGTLFGLIIGLNWAGAILFGSALSSHTLIALPVIGRLGVMTNEAVSVTVGATVFTDISAFLVLAVIAGSQKGNVPEGYVFQLLLLIAIYAAVILFGLPRAGKWFFRRFSGQTVEFQFVLMALLVSAMLAELIGMHAVVGAFLAGLAINSTLPHHSPVIGRVLFIGSAFFIPVFLMESGMITDPMAFVRGAEILGLGLAITLIAYLAKWIAAWAAARIFGYTREELWVVWGLSQAQAAVTLPTILIGIEVGLFPQNIFNATMLMILFTSITSPLIVQRYGTKLRAVEGKPEKRTHFDRILIPVANPDTQEHLITLASILAKSHQGTLYPLQIMREVNGFVENLALQRKLLDHEVLQDPEVPCQLVRRIDNSISQGILRAAVENEATMIVMGWRGRPNFQQSVLGTVLDEVVWKSHIPVLIGHITKPINAVQRVVMVVAHHTGIGHGMLEIVTAMTDTLNVPLHVLAWRDYVARVEEELGELETEHPFEIVQIGDDVVPSVLSQIKPNDLVVVTAMGSSARFRSSLGDMPEDIVANTRESVVVFHYA
jgi:Kef-type K+ transport system membrane component KefB/nucleotide-binding universal stress UspA family protein